MSPLSGLIIAPLINVILAFDGSSKVVTNSSNTLAVSSSSFYYNKNKMTYCLLRGSCVYHYFQKKQ